MPNSHKYPRHPEDYRFGHPDLFRDCRTRYPQPKIVTGEYLAVSLSPELEQLRQQESRLGPIFDQMCQQGRLAALEAIVTQHLTAQQVMECYDRSGRDLSRMAKMLESSSVTKPPTAPNSVR